MGIDNIMTFLWNKAPQTITEPVSLQVSFPNAVVFVDAFPWFYRCWCSLFGGVNDPTARQVQNAVQFFSEILDQWLDDYGFDVTFIVDPALASSLKQPEQRRRRLARQRAQQRTRVDIRRFNNNTLSNARYRVLMARTISQGFGQNRQALSDYLEKRRRQIRTLGITVVNGFLNAIQQRITNGSSMRLVYAPTNVEGEMYACYLADRQVLIERRKALVNRHAVLVITPDSDVLAYRSDYRVSRGVGWVWCANVLPNKHNPLNGNYDWNNWWNDPASDVAGIWRAIRPNAVRRTLRFSVARMTDFVILCKNTIRQTDLKGITCMKAFDLIRRYGRLEGVNANAQTALPRYVSNRTTWNWIYQNRQRLRQYWTHQPVP